LQEEYFNVGLTFELFLRAFGELDILHEEQITDDKLNGYKVLVLGDVKLLPAAVAARIVSFVRNGGILIADCVPRMDAHKQPLDVMEKLFGVRHAATGRLVQEGQWVPFAALPAKMSFPPPAGQKEEEARKDRVSGNAFNRNFSFPVISPRACELSGGKVLLKMRSGQPGLLYQKTGKGEAWLFGFCIQDSYFNTWKSGDTIGRKELRTLISDIFRDSHICSSNPDIEAGVRANDREGYVFIINHEAGDPGTLVRVADLEFPIGKIVDIESGKPVAFSRKDGAVEFTIEAPFGTTRLLKLSAE